MAIAALDVLEEENLAYKSFKFGEYMMDQLGQIQNPDILEIRGKGLLIGMEMKDSARPYCEQLKEEGLLCKETHENTIRFAPPLIISRQEMDWALERIRKVLKK